MLFYGIMKRCLLIMFMLWFVCTLCCGFTNASREDEACKDWLNCESASMWFKQPYCVTSNLDYAKSCIWWYIVNEGSSDQDSKKDLWNFQASDLIWQYCKLLLWNDNRWRIYFAKPSTVSDSWDWQQTFDSHQSLFLYALCSSFKDNDGNRPFLPENAALWSAFFSSEFVDRLKLHQKSWWKDLCSFADDQTLNNCDFSIYSAEIFDAIMSEIFKIKYSQVLHTNSVNWEDTSDKRMVESFLSWYFNFTEEYETLQKSFPQTIGVLKSNQNYYKKVLESLKIINNDKLSNIAKDSWCPMIWSFSGVDFVACALHWSQWKWLSLTPSFLTLFYNELLHYRVFVSYYTNWIVARNNKNVWDGAQEIFLSKLWDFQQHANIQVEAANDTLRDFEDFNMTYPLHIWILLYQEKMKKFRDKSLSPVVTIFYSLSEKLQNVQEPN